MTDFKIYDVFTKNIFSGNPLAVIPNMPLISDAKMLQIAGEFNLSETIFITAKNGNAYDVRIFTPGSELAFAGHPTIGGAIAMARLELGSDFTGNHQIIFNEKAGRVDIALQLDAKAGDYAEFTAPLIPVERKTSLTASQAAEILSLKPQDIGFENHQLGLFDPGTRFYTIPIASRAALSHIKLNAAAGDQYIQNQPHRSFYCYCPQTNENIDYTTRMFSLDWSMAEDPATGSAATSFAGSLAKYQNLADGEHRFTLEQGIDMGRPSQIYLTIIMQNGSMEQVKIGGHAVQFSQGTIL